MSATKDDAGSLPLPGGSLSSELFGAARLDITVRGRHRWNTEEHIELLHCYYSAKVEGKGYRRRLKELWDARNPERSFRSTDSLVSQARKLINLPQNELRELESHLSTLTDHVSATPLVSRSPLSGEGSSNHHSESSIDYGTDSPQLVISVSSLPPSEGDVRSVATVSVVIDGFDELLSCVRHCAGGDISQEMKTAFDLLSDCLIEMGTMELSVRSPTTIERNC